MHVIVSCVYQCINFLKDERHKSTFNFRYTLSNVLIVLQVSSSHRHLSAKERRYICTCMYVIIQHVHCLIKIDEEKDKRHCGRERDGKECKR